MKTIIAGSRNVTNYDVVSLAVEKSGFAITTVLSGGASGVDGLGEQWAARNGVPVEIHKADWEKYGRAAGPIRNGQMAMAAEALVAVWDGKSRGTANMIASARRRGLKVFVWRTDESEDSNL